MNISLLIGMMLVTSMLLSLLIHPIASTDINELVNLAEQGDPEAQYNLARKYLFGDGADHNDDEALIWVKKAAEQGIIA